MCQTISNIRLPRISTRVLICAVMLFAGCATGPETSKIQSGGLPKPGAKIVLATIGNKSGEAFEYDVENLLRNAIETALKKENLSVDTAIQRPDFTLSLFITEYRPGNAFKRWLLPGYGGTVLAVDGELRDTKDHGVIATITHKQGVYAGGAYSIGAWEYIFNTVAADIARDLRVKIEEGGAFVVRLPPRSDIVPDQKPEPSPHKVRIGSFEDRRPEAGRIGMRTAAFNVSMGNVYFYRVVPDFLRESLETELALMGYRSVDTGGDINVSGEVVKFWIETKTTPLYWDIVGDVQIKLTIASDRLKMQPTERVFSCSKKTRTYAWPTEKLFSEVMDACMNDVMQQIKTNNVWERLR
ncbi:MAG: DUF4410 domain-containing protein [Desulfobacteraceae bacterium]|nr:DUF4410 domain-containing protein [Desulfobacteraceae bacterium]